MDEISVLVCDDSALMRNLISRIVDSTPGLTVVGKAMNGQFAVEKIPMLKPDVLVLDIEMPVMNGIEFLKYRKEHHIDIPVVILSSIAEKGAAVTMECLELGASDFITKPNGSESADINSVAARLVELLSSYGGKYARAHGKNVYSEDYFVQLAAARETQQKNHDDLAERLNRLSATATEAAAGMAGQQSAAQQKIPFEFTPRPPVKPVVITPVRDGGRIEIIAIGISTGGPNALREVFKNIDPHLKQPILVVQHMPAGFTAEFANSLDHICALEVKEAADGDIIKSGRILIAPGNFHIYVEQHSLAPVIRLSSADPRNGHRPSADVLFESVAKAYQNRALGVIMTGMGRDGAAQLAEMRRQGAWTLGQDEESSVVYGMPKVGFELGAVQKQVSLANMADAISSLAREHS
jgi:two-component system, chemotaxis family, protein-glutamate methylesterase/glutaminase